MINEVIENIIDAEKRAEEIVKNSQVKAKEMIAKAKDVAIVFTEEEKKRVDLDVNIAVNNANAKADEISREKINECIKETEVLKDSANKNVSKAIDYIVGSMKKKYDC